MSNVLIPPGIIIQIIRALLALIALLLGLIV